MRLIVEPRVILSDGHLTGLLGLARVIVRWLDLRAKEAVGFRWEGLGRLECVGREGVGVPYRGGKGKRRGRGRGRAILRRVDCCIMFHHECFSSKPSQDSHGPLGPPRFRCGCGCFFVTWYITAQSGPVTLLIVILCYPHRSLNNNTKGYCYRGINDTCDESISLDTTKRTYLCVCFLVRRFECLEVGVNVAVLVPPFGVNILSLFFKTFTRLFKRIKKHTQVVYSELCFVRLVDQS